MSMGNNIHGAGDEIYLNADFDRTLRGAPSLLEEKAHTYVHEMSQHYLFAGSPSDTVIVHRPVPEDFLAYLAEKGLEPAASVLHPGYTPPARFTPFGWNQHAEDLSRRYFEPAAHPDLDAVRRANSRTFSHAVERELSGGEEDGSLLCDSLPGLEAHLARIPSATGWVAKGNHGHAGTANRRLPPGPLGEADRHALGILFHENGRVALEPWHERVQDMAVNFRVDAEGRIGALRGHELLNSRDGAFLGVKVSPAGQAPERWREDLARSAEAVGRSLRAIGYFGPVSLDAYSWRGPEGIRLRPVVDINARLSMALPAHGLSRRLPGRILLWTWAKPRKLGLPSTYAELKARLGAADFSADTRSGILAVSPIRLEGPFRPEGDEALRPKRVGFAFCARDEEELASLRRDFHGALGRA